MWLNDGMLSLGVSSALFFVCKRLQSSNRKMAIAEYEELKNHFKTHSRIREVTAHSAKVHTVDWNCDGRRLASGSFDKTVCVFTVDTDRLVSMQQIHLYNYLKINRNISCVQVKEQTFVGHNDSVDQLCWHESNPDLLSTASGDKTMRVWDARIKKSIATVNTKGTYSCNQHY